MDDLNTILDLLPFLAPLIILELGLMVFALVDLIKRKNVKGGNKTVWALIIIFIQVIGPCLYLFIGRKEPVIDSD